MLRLWGRLRGSRAPGTQRKRPRNPFAVRGPHCEADPRGAEYNVRSAAWCRCGCTELAELENQRERWRYERQEDMITSLREAGRLRPELDHAAALDAYAAGRVP